MFSRLRLMKDCGDDTTRAEPRGGIIPSGSQRPRCAPTEHCPAGLFQRNLAPAEMAGDGVSTYLALIFGTLLSSQGTDASFVLTLSGFPPGFSLRSCVSDSIRPFPVPIPCRLGLSNALGFRLSAFRHSLR